MKVQLPAPLRSLGSCDKGGTAGLVTRTFCVGVILIYKKGMCFDVQWGCLENGTRLICAEWRDSR